MVDSQHRLNARPSSVRPRCSTAALLGALGMLASLAHGDELLPGIWKLRLEWGAGRVPNQAAPAEEVSGCLEKYDLEEPERLLLGFGLVAAYACDIRDVERRGPLIRFGLTCASPLGITGEGRMTLAGQRLDGELNAKLGAAPGSTMQNRLHGDYQGPCPQEGVRIPWLN